MKPLFFVLFAFACRNKEVEIQETGEPPVADEDGDGALADADCDDNDASRYPGAAELCDGVDQDCDGEVDEEATDAGIWYEDADSDGYGDDLHTLSACEAPPGYAAAGGDCDDRDPLYHPNADEADCTDPADYNCDGSSGYADADRDGFPACQDCDDGESRVNPNATELCNSIDDDCDGQTDEPDAANAVTFYPDTDGDGYGDLTYPAEACTAPEGYVTDATDCDDARGAVHPGATELCNDLDDDCDGLTDPDTAADADTWYIDTDQDGYGNPRYTQASCEQPSGYVDNNQDCDDGEASAYTGAAEACDGIDNDCDSSTDEGVTTAWLLDRDGDGYGAGASTQACSAPTANHVSVSGDCDDTNGDAYPGAPQACDGSDLDCDGLMDNDADLDGYPDLSCGGEDCDDSDASIYPNQSGLCALGATCLDILNAGLSQGDGVYTIDPDGPNTGDDPFETWCDMSTDGGGWSLVGYSYAGSTTISTSNHNFRSLMCGGGSFLPESRGQSSAAIDATTLVTQSTEIAFSMEQNGAAVNTGSMSDYAAAWKFTIPDPSKVHFRNQSYYGSYWNTSDSGVGPCVPVTVQGIVGDTGVYSRYTLQNVLGTSWTDTYPTGYGVADNSSCVNHNGGPFITSIHTGHGWHTLYGSGVTECDVVNGSTSYTHRGNYTPSATGQTGSAAIWLR